MGRYRTTRTRRATARPQPQAPRGIRNSLRLNHGPVEGEIYQTSGDFRTDLKNYFGKVVTLAMESRPVPLPVPAWHLAVTQRSYTYGEEPAHSLRTGLTFNLLFAPGARNHITAGLKTGIRHRQEIVFPQNDDKFVDRIRLAGQDFYGGPAVSWLFMDWLRLDVTGLLHTPLSTGEGLHPRGGSYQTALSLIWGNLLAGLAWDGMVESTEFRYEESAGKIKGNVSSLQGSLGWTW